MANPSLSPVIPGAVSQLEPLETVDPEPALKKPRVGHTADTEKATPRLTTKEKSIIASIAAGDTHQEIARALAVSEDMLESELAGLYRKLSVANELELILFAIYHQLIGTIELRTDESDRATSTQA